MSPSVGKSAAWRQGCDPPEVDGLASARQDPHVRAATLSTLFLLLGCDKLSPGERAAGELSRAECVQMTIRVNELRNKELGRVNSKEQKNTVDRCMQHGSRAQYECVQFANNSTELARCDELAK